MFRSIPRPSAAMVVACLALLVALGGTSYATVLTVPRNSVGAAELKRNAVTPAKLAPNAVRSAHVLDGTLLTADFKPGQIPQGPKGDKGDKGPAGPTGISGYEIVRSAPVVVAANTATLVQARCPSGKKVIGGAAAVHGIGSGSNVFLSPSLTAEIYSTAAVNKNTSPRTVSATAICANVAS